MISRRIRLVLTKIWQSHRKPTDSAFTLTRSSGRFRGVSGLKSPIGGNLKRGMPRGGLVDENMKRGKRPWGEPVGQVYTPIFTAGRGRWRRRERAGSGFSRVGAKILRSHSAAQQAYTMERSALL